jgi:hypothetical protein
MLPVTAGIARLTAEFDHETATTGALLTRLPADRLAWRRHRKSFAAGDLAARIVSGVG